MHTLTKRATEPILSLEEVLRRLPMTLIVGWICDDGIILAADDEASVKTARRFPQKQSGLVKLKKIGKDCVVGVTGNASRAWKTVCDVADSHGMDDAVEADAIAEEFKEKANQHFADERDLSFVIAGMKKTVEGKRKALFHVARYNTQFFEIWEPPGRVLYAGVVELCQFLEQFLPFDKIRTIEQAKRVATILILVTSMDVIGGVGNLGSIAQITEQGCAVLDGGELEPLRQIGRELCNDWKSALANRIL